MLPLTQKSIDQLFSPDFVLHQVEKIFRDPRFSGSAILKRFLEFVVHEKLEGRAHLVKEYTIALDVLKKPVNFNPQENCIVRIHAARLRKVLAEYYKSAGSGDEIRILLPKGHYVPVFCQKEMVSSEGTEKRQEDLQALGTAPATGDSLAVIPFQHTEGDVLSAELAEGLGVGLSDVFIDMKPLTVVSYSVMRMMPQRFSDMDEWKHAIDARYIFTGDIRHHQDKLRVTVQLVRSATGELVWSHQYRFCTKTTDIFDIQDEVTAHVFKSVRNAGLLSGISSKTDSMMAVA